MKMLWPFKFLTAALMVSAAPWIATSTVAGPMSPSPALQNAVPTSIETVQYTYGWNGSYRRADRRANRWDRRAYRRSYGYGGYDAYAFVPGAATSYYYYGSQSIAVPNSRSCATEYAGREEICGYYGSPYRRAYY